MGIYIPVLIGVSLGLLLEFSGLHLFGQYVAAGTPFVWIVGSLFLRKKD